MNDDDSMISQRVDELMDADSTDEDSMVILMESETFKKALRLVFSTKKPSGMNTPEAVNRMIKTDSMVATAEIVLTEYVRNQP